MGRTLKNHDLYMQRLEAYAAASHVELVWEEEPDGGAWVPARRLIRIDPHLTDSDEVATLCHELGHSEDDSFQRKRVWKKLDRAYSAFQRGRQTPEQYQAVIECEERAWRFGRAIAKRLKIPLGKWFDDEERSALAAYRSKGGT